MLLSIVNFRTNVHTNTGNPVGNFNKTPVRFVDKKTLSISIILPLQELELLREAYFAEFRRNLEGDILSETSGDFSSLLVSMLNAERDEKEEVDWDLAAKDAQKLIAVCFIVYIFCSALFYFA